jgi:hypothetical protein
MRQGAFEVCALRLCAILDWFSDESGEKIEHPVCDALRDRVPTNSPTGGVDR